MTASSGTVWAAAGINIALTGVVAAIAFTTLTSQWSTSNTLGQHTSTLSTMGEEVKQVRASVDAANAGILNLQRQVQAAQLDVSAVMAQAGIPLDRDITWASIGRQVIGFPKTDAAQASLVERNYQQVQVTPAVGGYVMDEASAQIVQTTIDRSIVEGAGTKTGSALSDLLKGDQPTSRQ